MIAACDFVVSETEVAVSVTAAGVGTLTGAVTLIATPDALDAADKVPHVAPLHPAPDKVQATPRFCRSFVTVAVNVLVPDPASTLAASGATVTAIAGGCVTVIVADADLVPSATAVAVMVIDAGEGTAAGAV